MIAKKCLQTFLCGSTSSRGRDDDHPDPRGAQGALPPDPAPAAGLLRTDGPATATSLAQRLDLNSGATSYHLRQLEKHGFVVDAPERGNARDRFWRAAHQSTRTNRSVETSDEGREATDAFGQALAVVHTEALQRSVEEAPTLPRAWRDASTTSDWNLRLTPERAARLRHTLDDLISGWDEVDEDAEGSADLVVQLHLFPRPGTVEPERLEET